MYYFLDDNMQDHKSGIEHAEIKRLNLFNTYNVPAKIMTIQYNNELHKVTRAAGIDDSQLVNLYDYFQEAFNIEDKPKMIQDIQIDSSWRRAADGASYNYYDGDQRMMYIRRRSENDKRVMNLQYFDHFGKLLNVKWFDVRGFISVEQVYGWDGKISIENYLKPDGTIAIQKARMHDRQGKDIEHFILNYHQQKYSFANFTELASFFYDQVVVDDQLNEGTEPKFIVDRSYELAWPVFHMKNRVYRAMQLHNNHVNDSKDMLHAEYNYNYAYGLNHLTNWDGLIGLTHQQKIDLDARFGDEGVKIYQIPGPIVPEATLNAKRVEFAKRTPLKVVMVARISSEKQQDQLAHAWKQVIAVVPEASLDFWGYENEDFGKKVKAIIKEEQLEKSITFKGYTSDVASVYDDAQLLILPSRAEGLPLSLVEAQSHGLPIISNDIKYGPADVVIDGQDGILTTNGDIDGLAKAIISLLTDQKKLEKFSENAYEDSKRYSEAAVMDKWNVLIKDAEQFGKEAH